MSVYMCLQKVLKVCRSFICIYKRLFCGFLYITSILAIALAVYICYTVYLYLHFGVCCCCFMHFKGISKLDEVLKANDIYVW